MRKILAGIKVIAFISATLGIYSLYAVGYVFLRLTGFHSEPWRNICLKFWGKVALTCLGVKTVIEGKPPEPPFFLVSNHLSYIDILVYYYALKTTFVSKAEVKHWPLLGMMARTLGIIFIDRTRKRDVHRVNTIISEQINDRQGVVLFPEGKTSPGDEILPFRPSLLQYAAEEEINVHYAAIRYQTGENDIPARISVSWWQDDIPLLTHLFRLASNRSITANVIFGEKEIVHMDRKLLAEKLYEEVNAIFHPMNSS